METLLKDINCENCHIDIPSILALNISHQLQRISFLKNNESDNISCDFVSNCIVYKCLFAISDVSPRGRGHVSSSALPAAVPVEGRKTAEAEQVGEKGSPARVSATLSLASVIWCGLSWAKNVRGINVSLA